MQFCQRLFWNQSYLKPCSLKQVWWFTIKTKLRHIGSSYSLWWSSTDSWRHRKRFDASLPSLLRSLTWRWHRFCNESCTPTRQCSRRERQESVNGRQTTKSTNVSFDCCCDNWIMTSHIAPECTNDVVEPFIVARFTSEIEDDEWETSKLVSLPKAGARRRRKSMICRN